MRKSLVSTFQFVLVAALILTLTSAASAGKNKSWFKWHDTIEGSGKMVTQAREIEPFVNLDANGSFDIEIRIGSEPSLELTFDDNIIDLIDTRVRGKTLFIDSDEGYSSRHACKVVVTVPKMESVQLNGSGDVFLEGIHGEIFECELNGSGDVVASGEIDELEIDISGSGDVDARELKAKNAYVRIHGSGDVKVFASEDFDGAVYGSGDIKYYGNPKHKSTHVAGSGSIKGR